MSRSFRMSSASLSLLLLALVGVSATVGPSPPTMIKEPKNEQLFQVSSGESAGRPFLLECEAEGSPDPTYEWTKNNQEFNYQLHGTRILRLPGRGTLVFINPEDGDEGLYQCRSSNGYGTSVSNAVFVRRSVLNPFPEDRPKVLSAVEGQPLSLKCNPPHGYPRPGITWMINLVNGALRSINTSRISIDPQGGLHFAWVERGDGLTDALYGCIATSKFLMEYKMGNKVQLIVEPATEPNSTQHSPIRQYVTSGNVLALRDEELKLYCIFGGSPLPQISWRKRNSNLDTSRVTTHHDGRMLVIRSLQLEDEGVYECQADNGVGLIQSHAINVTVKSAPYWLRVSENMNAVENQTVDLECMAGGIPDPTIQWYINGIPLQNAEPNPRRHQVHGHLLTLEGLTKADTAVYQCNASNPHGYAFKNFYLNVVAHPATVDDANAYVDLVLNDKLPSRVRSSSTLYPVVIPVFSFEVPSNSLTNRNLHANLTEGTIQNLDTAVKRMGDCLAPANKDGVSVVACTLDLSGIHTTFIASTRGDNLLSSLKQIWVHVLTVDTVARFEATRPRGQRSAVGIFQVSPLHFTTTYDSELSLNTERQRQFKDYIEVKVREALEQALHGEYMVQLNRVVAETVFPAV